MKIRNIGKTEPKIVNIGQTQPKVVSELVAKTLGAEHLGSVRANTHNLPLPKPVQNQLVEAKAAKDERVGELVAAETK